MPLFFQKLDKAMDKFEQNIVGYATIIFTLIMFTNVVLRFFGGGLKWGNELSSYMNIIAVFIVISAGFKHGDHVGVDAFVRLLPDKLKKPVSILTNICSLTFCILISYLSIRMMIAQAKQVSPVLHIPLSVLYGAIAIGMAMSSIRLIMEIIKTYNGPREELTGGDK